MSDCDLLKKGDSIKSRWRITHKIGGGGFGQIYQAYDKLRQEFVAVKVESNSQSRQGIRMEVTVLRRIQNRQHICELFSGGVSTLYNYMIMTLLGLSLSEIRRNTQEQRFTLSTTLRISLQILEAIESIHSIGFLHRDIKPSNFAIGRANSRQIYILDFGLARKYTDYGQHVRPARTEAGFRGTIRYASINAHNSRDLGRHDDLWSCFYMLIEFLLGSLPWSKMKDKETVGHMKATYDYTQFFANLPDVFENFLEHINDLKYEDKPNYEYLRLLFVSTIQRLGYHDDDPYDWEKSIEQDENDALVRPVELKSQSKQLKNDDQRINCTRNQIKHDTIGVGDQQAIMGEKMNSQLNHRSPDTLVRCSVYDAGQAISTGLLTYVSQQFSNTSAPAAATGVPSLFSQRSPRHDESQCSIEQNIQVPFGSYTESNNRQRTSSPFHLQRFSS
ncbi:unnamed protein product [Adineta ricciae]|uniref:Protein kinase domain-containing protein n=1 Tax=Adineta ricciae TaxID=249248 RepID=A0A816AR12_ADIRI|nr:unnamed protein product [Adineta ricciae]CAF1598970.1 unnamed protein product [Adineta ricciae]